MFSSNFNYVHERLETVGREVSSNPIMGHAAERRINGRVVVSLEAEWEGLSGMSGARVVDLSQHGCFIETFGQVVSGEIIKFRIRTPTGRWLQIRGEVAHYQTMVGFGLRFTEMSPQDQAMIRQLLEFYC